MDRSVSELIDECKKISDYCRLRSQECQAAGSARENFARKMLLQYPAVIAAALPLIGASLSIVASLCGVREMSHFVPFCGPAVCASFSLLTAVLCLCGFDRDFSGQQNLASVLQALAFRADSLSKTATRLPPENFASMVRSLKSEFQGVIDAAGLSGRLDAPTVFKIK